MDIKRLRQEMNVTQQELADLCRVRVRTVQNWEYGTMPIPASKELLLENIAKNHKVVVMSAKAPSGGDGAASGFGGRDDLNDGFEKFCAMLTQQQDIMRRQLEELAEMRKLAQKKDEQIDTLLHIVQQKTMSVGG